MKKGAQKYTKKCTKTCKNYAIFCPPHRNILNFLIDDNFGLQAGGKIGLQDTSGRTPAYYTKNRW